MLPDERKREPSAEPVTPEVCDNVKAGEQHGMMPSAPKGKPKAPPLIHGKVKPIEDNSVPGGSKIPLIKTKYPAVLQSDDYQTDQLVSNGSSRSRSNKTSHLRGTPHRSSSEERSARTGISDLHRTVEKVKVSKGIEMNRIVQETIDSKRTALFNARGIRSSSVERTSKLQTPNRHAKSRVMKTVEASVPETANFSKMLRPKTGKTVSKNQSGRNNSSPPKVTPNSNGMETQEHLVAATVNGETKLPFSLESAYKTVDEFLKMPETALPESKQADVKKSKIYKSKFWKYLDKNQDTSKCHSNKDQKKPYDPEDVKSFMQKQKELRRQQQLKESKNKQEECMKRQKMLKELDSKCQKIALKGRSRSETAQPSCAQDEVVAKKFKLELESPSAKYLKPLLGRQRGSQIRKSTDAKFDSAQQARYLLSEFESIVKRECLSFFQQIPNTTSTRLPSDTVDKSVCTSLSLMQTDHESVKDDTESSEVNIEFSHAKVIRAATKIQACFRGYKIRQAMRDAKLIPLSKFVEKLQFEPQVGSWNNRRTSRRWSFPRLPEKPYDNNNSLGLKLQPMSPIPMITSSDPTVPCYIPPPPSSSQTLRSPSKPRVLPSFPLTPVRLRVYDEPYPKYPDKSQLDEQPVNRDVQNARRSLPSVRANTVGNNAASLHSYTRRSCSNLESQPPLHVDPLEFTIPTPLPSIVDVLREKVRLLSSGNNVVAPLERTASAGREKIHSPSLASSYENEFEASGISSATRKSAMVVGKEAGDCGAKVNNESRTQVESEHEVTPRIKKHKRRPRPHSHRRSSSRDSSTTVDTDVELAHSSVVTPTAPSSGYQKESPKSSSSKSEYALGSRTYTETTTSSSMANLIAPALRLRYEAEKEHLQIIEKALHIKLQGNSTQGPSELIQADHSKVGNENSKSNLQESDRIQLAIANCHKESMKAAAEMAKWMADFRRTSMTRDEVQPQQTPVDLAAMVYAAVEQARQVGEDKRREQEHHKNSNQNRSETDREELTLENHNNKTKTDKSVATNLRLANVIEKADESLQVEKITRDYQQQFPSESERDSPLVPSFPRYVSQPHQDLITASKCSSGHSNDNDASGTHLDEANDYQSLIPSGNTVEFTSLGPKVSSIGEDDLTGPSSFAKDDTDKQTSEIEDLNQEAMRDESISNVISEKLHSNEQEDTFDVIETEAKISENVVYDETSFENEEVSRKSELQVQSIDTGSIEDEGSALDDEKIHSQSKNNEFSNISENIQSTENEYASDVSLDIVSSHKDQGEDVESKLESSDSIHESVTPSSKTHTQTLKNPQQQDVSRRGSLSTISIQPEEPSIEADISVPQECDKNETSVIENLKPAESERPDSITPEVPDDHASLDSVKELVEAILSNASEKSEQFVYDDATFDTTDASQKLEITEDRKELDESVKDVDISNGNLSSQDDSKSSPFPVVDIKDESQKSAGLGSESENSLSISKSITPEYIPLKPPPPYRPKSPVSENTTSSELSNIDVQNVERDIPELISDEETSESGESSQKPTPAIQVGTGVISNSNDASSSIEQLTSNVQTADGKGEALQTENLQVSVTSDDSTAGKPDLDVPLKPPPPYSPSSSLDSTSLSSKSLIISLQNEKLQGIVQHQANMIWEAWQGNGTLPDLQLIMKTHDANIAVQTDILNTNDGNGNVESQQSAGQNFDRLLYHLIYETIKEVLQVGNSYMPYIERVRPGPLSLQAQKLRIPKSVDSLISIVMKLVVKSIPTTFFSDPVPRNVEADKSKMRKWCSRPRELVDEVLLEELVEEDYQWTEWWPEEVIVLHQVSEKIVKSLIRDTLKKRAYVFQH